MKSLKIAFKLVFSEKKYYLIAIVSAALLASFYLFAGQIIVFFPQGIYIELSVVRISAVIILSILFGISMALTAFNLRKAKISLKSGGTNFGGIISGLVTCGCCVPLLPSLLVMFGFTGTSILSINTSLQKYLIPLVLFGIGALTISLKTTAESITKACEVKQKYISE